MIKGINSSSRYMAVTGGTAGSNYFNSFSGQTMVGQLRFNPATQGIEVYDGNTWQQLQSSYTSVGLTWDAEQAIEWAIKKKQEEQELDELCKKHPAVAEAYERLQIIKALTKQGDSNREKE